MAKNYMADVAKLLGIELDEEFMVTEDDNIYKLTKDGLKYKSDDGNWYYVNDVFLNLLDGTLEIVKLPWQPKCDEKYYHPSTYFQYADVDLWNDCSLDFALKEADMAFRTKEECEAALPELRKKYLGE